MLELKKVKCQKLSNPCILGSYILNSKVDDAFAQNFSNLILTTEAKQSFHFQGLLRYQTQLHH